MPPSINTLLSLLLGNAQNYINVYEKHIKLVTASPIQTTRYEILSQLALIINQYLDTSSISDETLSEIKHYLKELHNGFPFVAGDLEVRITVNFPVKSIIVYDENDQQIDSFTNTNYAEIAAKTNCIPAGHKYKIKIIGHDSKNTYTKTVEKNVSGDLVIYVLPDFDSSFKKYTDLVNAKKYEEAAKFIITSYGFDKNQCPSYKIKITDDSWTGLTTEGEICGEQTINIRTGFLKVGIKDQANFSQIISAIGHEFVHIRQKGDLGITEHNEREFLAYYWEVFQEGLPVMPFRRKFAAEKALNDYVKKFNDAQKLKYSSHIKQITKEYEDKYKDK